MNAEMIDRALAGNPSVPRDILERLAGSGDVYTLRNLLGNPRSTADCCERRPPDSVLAIGMTFIPRTRRSRRWRHGCARRSAFVHAAFRRSSFAQLTPSGNE
jgi:hypothetical protein